MMGFCEQGDELFEFHRKQGIWESSHISKVKWRIWNNFQTNKDQEKNNKDTHIVEVGPEVRALEHGEPVT